MQNYFLPCLLKVIVTVKLFRELTSPIEGNLKFGEELSLIIYLRDPNGLYDVAVRDCWAYDDGNTDVESTLKLQLTSTDGCAKYIFNFRNIRNSMNLN